MPLTVRALAGALVLAASAMAALASDPAAFKSLKSRYGEAAKKHDRDGMIERRDLILDMYEYVDQKACRKFLRKIFGSERWVDNRVAVVQVLGAGGDVKDVDFLVSQLGSKKERHRGPKIALGEGLSYTDPAAQRDVAERALALLKKTRKKPDLHLSLLEGAGSLEMGGQFDRLQELAAEAGPRDLFELNLGMGIQGGEKAVPVLEKATGHADWRACLGAVLGLAATGSEKAHAKLVELIGHRDPRVAEAAAEALGTAAYAPATKALVSYLGTAPLRGREVARAALKAITSKDFGHDTAAWQAHLDGKPPAAPPAAVVLPRFFGQEVPTDRVVLFLDLSRSMSWKGRLPKAQDGLVAFLESLPADAEVGCVGATRDPRKYSEGPVAAGEERAKLTLWIREQLTAGGIDMKRSLLGALKDHPEADTFVIATDSQPNGTGGEETSHETMEIFRQINRVRRIRLYIAFTVPDGRLEANETSQIQWDDTVSNLTRMAESTGGTFILVD